DCEHEIELRRARLRKLFPRFRAKGRAIVIQLPQQPDRVRVDRAFGMAAGAERAKLAAAFPIENRLGYDRARRIAGAEEEDVIGRVDHVLLQRETPELSDLVK